MGDPTGIRLAIWFAFAVSIVAVCFHFRLSLPGDRAVELLSAKLAFLALIGAVATFQYGVWRELVEKSWERISDARWTVFEAQVRRDQAIRDAAQGGAALPNLADLHQREVTLEAWLAWKADQIKEMLTGILPHCRIVLTNYLVVAYLLFESSVVDLVSLVLRAGSPLIGAISAGALLATILPFTEVWVRYALSLPPEFTGWQRGFERQMPRPPEMPGGTR